MVPYPRFPYRNSPCVATSCSGESFTPDGLYDSCWDSCGVHWRCIACTKNLRCLAVPELALQGASSACPYQMRAIVQYFQQAPPKLIRSSTRGVYCACTVLHFFSYSSLQPWRSSLCASFSASLVFAAIAFVVEYMFAAPDVHTAPAPFMEFISPAIPVSSSLRRRW